MKLSKISVWISNRREALRYGFYSKQAGYLLLFYIVVILLFGALLVFHFERGENPNIHSYWDALWMIFITVATIGYGDIVPVTNGGRVAVIFTITFGVATLSAFITLLASRRAEKVKRRYRGLHKAMKIEDHVVVCGWNSRGIFVLNRLREELKKELTKAVLLADIEEDPINDGYTYFLRGDPTSAEELRRANVGKARAVILLADESKGGSEGDIDARTVLTALTLKDINPDMKITAEALETENIHHLELAGVVEILDSNSLLGNLIARSALHYGLISTVAELASKEAGMHTFFIPTGKELTGKTRKEAEAILREKHGSQLVAITSGRDLKTTDKDYLIAEDDKLMILADEKPSLE
jgi:voltage-gated potassium channel